MNREDNAAAHDHASFLAGSVNRIRVLRELRERPGRGSELAKRCSLPRSTVHRCLDGVTTRGWARKTDGDYRLTAPGALVLGAYEDLVETIEITSERESVLAQLGAIGRTLPVEGIASATVVESTPQKPYATMEHYIDAFESGSFDRMYGIVPITSRLFNEAGEPLVEANVELEMVIDEGVLRTARETFPEAHRRGLDSDNFALYVHPEPLSFGLAIFDDERVLVGAYDDQGNPRACLDGTGDTLVEWATGTYARYRGESKRIDVEAAPEA